MNNEILDILQEEAAEVIQAVSKVRRFGIDNAYNGVSNRDHLTEEVGDLLAMVQLLIDTDVIDSDSVIKAKWAKMAKLEKWSNICFNIKA